MNILITSYFYEYNFGGAEMVARSLVEGLQGQGHSCDVLCLTGGPNVTPARRVYRIPVRKALSERTQLFKRTILFFNNLRFDASVLARAKELAIDFNQYDLVHCQDLNALHVSYRLAKEFGKPLVVTMHDKIPKTVFAGLVNPFLTRLMNWFLVHRARTLTQAFAFASRIICVSKFLRGATESFLGLQGIAAVGKTTTIYPALEEYLIESQKTSQSNPSLDSNILFYGRLTKEKGIDLLLAAFSQLDASYTLTVLGIEGPLSGLVKKWAGHNPRIEWLRAVPHREIPGIMAQHGVVCCPSMFEEPFGKTVLESRFFQKKTVATKVGGIPEILENYPMAYLCDVQNSSRDQIIDSLKLRIEQAKSQPAPAKPNGLLNQEREFMVRFLPETFYQAHNAVYSEILTPSGAARRF